MIIANKNSHVNLPFFTGENNKCYGGNLWTSIIKSNVFTANLIVTNIFILHESEQTRDIGCNKHEKR